jgi:hypothetical protein
VVTGKDGELAVRRYDDLRLLEDDLLEIPPDACPASSTDQLAELVISRYHLLADGADVCYCGGIDRAGNHLTPLDDSVPHRVDTQRSRPVWSDLISATAEELDGADRSRPLSARRLPKGSADKARNARLCVECFHQAVLDACYPEEPGRYTEEELRAFVVAWLDRRVFSHLHCCETDHLHLIFMCLALGPPMPADFVAKIGLVYEYMDRSGQWSVNGYPTFLSHRLMHIEDWARVRPVIQAEEDRRQNLAI